LDVAATAYRVGLWGKRGRGFVRGRLVVGFVRARNEESARTEPEAWRCGWVVEGCGELECMAVPGKVRVGLDVEPVTFVV